MCQKTFLPISDDLGLSEPRHSSKNSQKKVYLYRTTRRFDSFGAAWLTIPLRIRIATLKQDDERFKAAKRTEGGGGGRGGVIRASDPEPLLEKKKPPRVQK